MIYTMKKFLFSLLMPLALIVSCEKPEPEPDPVVGKITLNSENTFVFSDEGDSRQVAFSATLDWKAASSADWLTVEPRSGQAGETAVTLKAGKNADYDTRSATVTLTCGEDSKTVTVTQKQKGALLLTDSVINVGAEGGLVNITAKANSNVTAKVDAGAAAWITDVTTKALVDYKFDFDVKSNPDETPRSGSIVFSNEAGSETVTITQAGIDADYNVWGKVTCGNAGVPDVLVSDGVEIVKTDANGNYRLQSEKKWKYVFMTIPSGYEAPLDGIQPEFWKELKENAETPEEVNFELIQTSNDDYTLFVLGDMHLARRTGDLAQFEKVAGDLNKYIAAAPGKVYCLTLGDMTWDMYWVANNFGFTEYLETMNGYFTNVPFFHTMGNHDNEMEKAGDWEKAFAYTENIAPDYYSFNLGKIHYIVMDNMDFTGVEPGEDNRSKYAKNFTAAQLEWLRKDLSYVDKSTPVFVTAHEPLARPSGIDWKEQLNGKDADLDTFIGIFDGYNVRYLSGHTHNIFNKNWTSTFTEHNSGAVCASWWWSGYHTPGIHIAQDGAPGGWTVWTVNGTKTTHYYQAALQPREYQFRAYDMNKVKEVISEDRSTQSGYTKYYNHIQSYGDNVILVNVWDYDDDWTVEISENGTPLDVAEVGVYDPLHIEAMTIPRLNKNSGTTTFSTAKWRHFFQATASAADTPVTVKVTDRYGNVYTENMVRPKAFTVNEYKNEVVRIPPSASFVSSSSSTAVFGWTTGGTAAEDADVPYKLELFKDAACTNLQVSFDIEAGNGCWSGKSLRFVFGGLQPETKYWFRVTNTETGEVSGVVEGQTTAFTVVDPTTVFDAGVGDVILAEDFSEISWGPDEFAGAAGFVPSPKNLNVPSGVNPSGTFTAYDNTGNRIFGTGIDLGSSRLSKGWGFFGNSSTYLRNAYLRVGASGGRTHMVTPALSGIPDGMTATIEVTVTATKYDSGMQIAAFAVKGLTQSSITDPGNSSYKKYTGDELSGGQVFDITTVKSFDTGTVTLENVDCDCQLLIGSAEDNDGKNRFYLSDVTVKIVSLAGEAIPLKSITDEASFLSFVNDVAGGNKTLAAKVKQNISLSAATAEAFASIEDFEGTLDGSNHTISGLTKPLFNNLKGTVKNLTLNSTLNITADQTDIGILANVLSGTASGCISKGSVTFNVAGGVTEEHRIGGLIGKAESSGATVTNCTNEASVTNETTNTTDGELIVGGVLGTFWGTQFSISGCVNTGVVTNKAYWEKAVSVGGIIGQAGNSSGYSCDLDVTGCTNRGVVSNFGNSASSNNVGGVIGWIRFGTYSENSNKGTISNSGEAPNNYIGGVFGYVDKKCTFQNHSNSGTVSNSGEAASANNIGGIIGSIAGAKPDYNVLTSGYKFTNSGDIENSGSAKNINIGGLVGRNNTGYFTMTGTSSVYSTNSGDLTDTSGNSKSDGGDISIGGIVGYTTTGIKAQYIRNFGNITVHGDKGNSAVNVGGIGGWISNASFNFNNCRNSGNVTIDCTTTSSIWAAGIVGCPKNNNTLHYYWYSNAVIDTHAATVGGENYTAGLMGTHEGKYDSNYTTFTMYGHKLAGTVWGNKTTTGLFICTKDPAYTFSFQGGTSHPNTIAPGTVRKDNTHDDTVNSIEDLNIGILAGGAGSTADVPGAIEKENLTVAEW